MAEPIDNNQRKDAPNLSHRKHEINAKGSYFSPVIACHAFTEVQQSSSLNGLWRHSWHDKQFYQSFHEHPLGVMNKRKLDHKQELTSYTDKDNTKRVDTISKSTSGIASDIDKPRMIRSTLFETPRLPVDMTVTNSSTVSAKTPFLVQRNVNSWNQSSKEFMPTANNRCIASNNNAPFTLKQFDKSFSRKLKDVNVTTGLHNSYLLLNNGVFSDFSLVKEKNACRNSKNWKSLSLLNSSSPVWFMKLLESTPTLHPHLLLKARLFRRWRMISHFRRVNRMEYDNKTKKSIEFWRDTILKKYFRAWQKHKVDLEIKADNLYHKHLTQMGLNSLQFAVQISMKANTDAKRSLNSHCKAKYWIEWRNRMTKRKREKLKLAFNRWRVFHLENSRDKILEGIASKHIMSRNYIKWKMRYSIEQNNSVAGLTFQITLLTKCWHSWRIFTTQSVVKTRINEVARIQYENALQTHVFQVWIAEFKKILIAKNLAKRRLVVNAFYSWRNWTQYAKVIHQRFQSMCKQYHSRALLKQNFVKWKQRLMLTKADNYHDKLLQRRVYHLWFLRQRRKVIHRHLCKAMFRKGKKRRFFQKWQNFTWAQQERNKHFVNIFYKMLLSKVMLTWKEHTNKKRTIRQRCDWLSQKKKFRITRDSFDQWLFSMKVANFKKRTKISWTKRCVSKACAEWKLLVKRKCLEHILIESRPVRDLWLLRAFWNAWKKQKELIYREHDHARSVITILTHNFKRRVFQAWRVTNQQEQIIAPTVARQQRKSLARVFDAWRLYIYRLKHVVEQHQKKDENLLEKHFFFWRERTLLHVKEYEATARLQCSKLTRAFLAWRDHIHNIRFERLQQRAQKLKLMSEYFKKWSERMVTCLEVKEREESQQAQKRLCSLWAFRYWKCSAVSQRKRLLQIEEKVVAKSRLLQLKRSMNIWHRSYTVADIVRTYRESCQERFLHKVFNAWSTLIKDEMNEQLNRFSSNLALDNSMGSTGGSFLRSTIDSSVSDFLSSGYWTTRRGSENVLRSPMMSQRDDDVASLPGRFYQMHPDSPRFGSVSPITLKRETNNMMSPLVTHTPNSSPSPSPPDLHLSLPTSTASSESVFLPVIDRKDSLQLRSELEGPLSAEDEECMSVISALSSASVRDKEMVVIDTILHWRSLPLSLTFRTWLKYTRQKKILRELLYFSRERKAQDVMRTRLKQWRRELYVTVTTRQYRFNSTRLRYLSMWRAYVERCRMKDNYTKSANSFNRCFLLKMFFNSWRIKYSAKMKLQIIVSQWQNKAVVTEKHKAIEEKIHSQCNQRDLRQMFQFWMLATRKSQEAQLFYLERLLPRSFFSWHQYSCTKSSNRKKALWFREQRVVTLAFRQWHEQYDCQNRAHEFIEAKELKFSIEIIQSWHEWATGLCTRRRLWRRYHRALQIKTLKEIFTVWLGQVKRRESARNIYEYSLLRRVLMSWQSVNNTMQENKTKACTLRRSCANRMLRQSFIFWRKFLIHRQLAVFHALQRDQNLVNHCVKRWRHYVLNNRAEKFFTKRILKKVFHLLCERSLERKQARHLLRYWKTKTKVSKALQSKAMEVIHLIDKKTLRQTFMFWIQETLKIQKAKQYYASITSKSSLLAWYSYVHTRVQCRKTLTEIEIANNKTMLSRSFLTWRESFLRHIAIQKVLDEYLQMKQMKHLQSFMLKWRKYILNCQARKHHNFRLLFKGFLRWKNHLFQKKELKKITERVFYRRIRRAAIQWKQWTLKIKQQQCQADNFQDINAVQMCFSYWVMATEKSFRAEKQCNITMLKRTMYLWIRTVKNKKEEREVLKRFQMQRMKKQLAVLWLMWKCELKQSKKNKLLVSNQKLKQSKRVLQASLRQWRKFTKKCRADKYHSSILLAQSFLEWKSRFKERLTQKKKTQVQTKKALAHYRNRLSRICLRSWYYDICVQKYVEMKQQLVVKKHFQLWKMKGALKSIASELGDHQLYCLYWGKWRNQLVRRRVAELMMKHEEKKLLSEVFGSWYKMTMIQRRLLKEWNTFLTEKWFRRWMQKYNES